VSNPPIGVPLPDRGKSYVRIVRATQGVVERCYSFSPAVVGRMMHWCDGRTELCLSPDRHCTWCHARRDLRWYGWLFGHSINHQCPCLIQLTETAVRNSVQLRDPSVSLRGAFLALSRAAGRSNSAVAVQVKLDSMRSGLPEDEPDVLAHLCRFYKLDFYPGDRHSLDGECDQ